VPRFIALRSPDQLYEVSMYAFFSHVVETPMNISVLGEVLARCDPFL